MPSKQVSDRQKAARAVAAAAEAHADDIQKGVHALLGKDLHKGEKWPDVALLVRLAGRVVERRMTALVSADDAHETELGDDAAPRATRDAAAEKVHATLVDLRGAVETAFGAEGLARLGLTTAVPSDPSVLALLGERVHTSLSSKKKMPKARDGVHIELATFDAELKTELAALTAAVGDVAREAREAQSTLVVKQRAMTDNDKDFQHASALIEVLALLGGLDELAGTVKPSGRKPGRSAVEDPAPSPTPLPTVPPAAT